jgi:hypothetical protein
MTMTNFTSQTVRWGNWTIEPDGTATYDESGHIPMVDATPGGLIRDVETRIEIEAHTPGETESAAADCLPPGYPMQHLLDLLVKRYPRPL